MAVVKSFVWFRGSFEAKNSNGFMFVIHAIF